MRLIATFDEEKEAFAFSSFLQKNEIANSYESHINPDNSKTDYQVWVVYEEDLNFAREWLQKFLDNPKDPQFILPETAFLFKKKEEEKKLQIDPPLVRRSPLNLTNLLIALCAVLFFWNGAEEAEILHSKGLLALQVELSPLQQELLFDYPKTYELLNEQLKDIPLQEYKSLEELPSDLKNTFDQADKVPYWKGIVNVAMDWKQTGWEYLRSVPMFEKIKKGELWRFFTPCLLHRDILHILFNMAWLFVLGRQIEERLKTVRMLSMILILGVVSNTAQYLMGGPYFLGFSGVVVGMVSYIWMRQKKAPWEGYPLHRSIAFFVFIFVAAMFGLEIISWGLQFLNFTKQSPNIANTAHIVGGLMGLWLGNLTFFARRKAL